ncbi:MAG: helix-turn-helix domain-containing protein [Methylobacter sp.]
MKSQYSNSRISQRQRILEWLRIKPMTTLEARLQLDVMHPSARIGELKEDGHNIIKSMVEDDSGKGKHKVAQYALLSNQA